jgi:hypothetical protein
MVLLLVFLFLAKLTFLPASMKEAWLREFKFDARNNFSQ